MKSAETIHQINRIIDKLQEWERHLRNPKKYSAPKTSFDSLTTRMMGMQVEAIKHEHEINGTMK